MKLLPGERRRLDYLEGILRAEEPKLASLFDMFTWLAREDGKPPAEGQFLADGPWREEAHARRRARWRRCLVLIVLLAAMIAIVATGLS